MLVKTEEKPQQAKEVAMRTKRVSQEKNVFKTPVVCATHDFPIAGRTVRCRENERACLRASSGSWAL